MRLADANNALNLIYAGFAEKAKGEYCELNVPDIAKRVAFFRYTAHASPPCDALFVTHHFGDSFLCHTKDGVTKGSK